MTHWHRFGRLPAVPVVGAVYAVAIAAGLLFDATTATAVGIGVLAVFAAYCMARPANGRDIFLLSAAPSAVAVTVEELAGVSRWWIAIPLIPLALFLIAQEDRDGIVDEQDVPVGLSRSSAPARTSPRARSPRA